MSNPKLPADHPLAKSGWPVYARRGQQLVDESGKPTTLPKDWQPVASEKLKRATEMVERGELPPKEPTRKSARKAGRRKKTRRTRKVRRLH